MTIKREYRDPFRGVEPFEERADESDHSRAAQVLLLADQLCRTDARAAGSSLRAAAPAAPVSEVQQIAVPVVEPLGPASGLRAALAAELAQAPAPGMGPATTPEAERLWRRADEGDSEAAARLVGASLDDPSAMVRIAAAVASLALAAQGPQGATAAVREQAAERLRAASAEAAPRIRNLGLSLAQRVEEPREAGRIRQSRPVDPEAVAEQAARGLSIGIHGTFGRDRSGQLTPGHAFYRYLGERFTPNLYSDTRSYYRWSGRYSLAAREKGARDLESWMSGIARVDSLDAVYGHSHGGNVALEAAARGTSIAFLVLLATPAVRRPAAEWALISSRVGHAVAQRTRLDLVMLMDWLLSRLPEFGEEQHEDTDWMDFPAAFTSLVSLPPVGWFSHGSWLERGFWESSGVADSVEYELMVARAGASSRS